MDARGYLACDSNASKRLQQICRAFGPMSAGPHTQMQQGPGLRDGPQKFNSGTATGRSFARSDANGN
jgi:hypothetical protein